MMQLLRLPCVSRGYGQHAERNYPSLTEIPSPLSRESQWPGQKALSEPSPWASTVAVIPANPAPITRTPMDVMERGPP
jgi:hypothetical protein